MFTIDKGIPIPKTKSGRDRKYPFRDMEVGDSFAVPAAMKTLGQRATYMFNRDHKNQRLVARTQPDGTLRVWRVK